MTSPPLGSELLGTNLRAASLPEKRTLAAHFAYASGLLAVQPKQAESASQESGRARLPAERSERDAYGRDEASNIVAQAPAGKESEKAKAVMPPEVGT